MKGFRKGTAHGLKAVGGSFMDADLKVHIILINEIKCRFELL